ncbi:MAG TPA: S8 family serine peptidase [Candidatus Saccharimonadales bacterium]|nr:S8 family serine peptidase [Candidatus Saccharimonadales bacterium]
MPGELLVGFQPNARALDRANARALVHGLKIKQFLSGDEHWKLGPGVSVDQAIAALSHNPHIRFAEPNYILHADVIPNDPRLGELWGMINNGQTGGTPDADIDADMAWGVSTGSDNVIVGVIDTGVDYNHPDLAANIWTNPGEIPGNGIDDDNNGYIDDVHGYDFYNHDGDPLDDHGHGTHVSGTIGAIGDNGIGVAGVNWHVKIMALKFLSSGGSGSTDDAVSAVDYSVMMGADLTSNSWGGGGFSQTLYDAIANANAHNMAFVAAAGNDGQDNDITPHYPSNYDLPNIIAVAATDDNDAKASFSDWGLTTVDLGAPGVDILSTLPGNSYGLLSGTSMATPHVSGVCALIRAVSPNIPVAQLKSVLLAATDPVASMQGRTVSGGRLNAFFAIAAPDDIAPDAIGDLTAANPTSNTMGLMWTATGDDHNVGTATYYEVRYSTSSIDETNWDMATRAGNEPTPSPSGSAESMEVRGLTANTPYYFAIKAFDEWGNASPVSNLATGMTLPPPTGSVSPTSINEALFTGGHVTHTATLSNVGVGTLDFSIPTPSVGEPLAVQPPLIVQKGEIDPRSFPPQTLGSGGPDAFGYRWTDSDEAGGPAFSWIDISSTGTPIAGLDGDDQSAGPIALGFDMPFYGQIFDSVHVNTNGWLSFTSTLSSGSSTYSNQPLPTSAGPENLVAPFWDDLHFRGVQRAYFQSFGSSAIIQWQDVDTYTTGSDLTFQVILESSGAITFQYLTVTGTTTSCTVGIQNATKTDGLEVAFNQTYLHDNLAVRIAAIPQWLSVAPTSGRLGAGESIPLAVNIDASGLEGGTYPGTINIQTNDPNNPVLTIAVTLDVTGAPDAAVQPASLDFGDRFYGLPDSVTLHVLNNGTDTLHVTGIGTSNPGELEPSPTVFDLAPHASQEVTVTWTPSMLGPFSGSLMVNSNDASEPTITVPVTGNAIPAPIMTTSPGSFDETLYSGNMVTRTLTIGNTGGSDLIVDTAADQGNGGTGLVVGKDLTTAGAGGPDGFGYRWKDSNEPGGPVFDWVDISSTGTPVSFSSSDDSYSGPVDMGLTFPFYGSNYTQFWVSTNGWLAFTAPTSSSAFNYSLPSTSGPKSLVAPFWDDLHLRTGDVRYLYDGSRLIVEFNGIGRYSPSTGQTYTFEVILYPNGKIVFQYLTMDGLLNSATTGIQNEARDTATQVNYNADYLENNMAIQISRVPDWLTVTPVHAVVPPGETVPFDVTFDATGRTGGVLNGGVVLYTNIPTQAEVHLPAVLTVIGAPQAAVYPASYDFGTVYSGYPHLTNFQVVNNGTDVLNVLSIVSSDPNNLFVEEAPGSTNVPEAAFPLAPGQSRLFNLRWSPSMPYMMNVTVEIHSDDPANPVLMMPVTGVAIPPPIAAWSPSSFMESLNVGDVVHRTLHLSNNGDSDLDFASSIHVLGGTPMPVAPEFELKKGDPDPRPGVLGTGGPDVFGYEWIDSDEAGGPAFNWVDISGIGTPITFSSTGYCDDCVAGPIPVGFDMPFYGNGLAELYVSTNGWASFDSTTAADYSNDPLPSAGAAGNLLAPFWDDLVLRSGTGSEPVASMVYYYNDGTRFILQFQHMYRLSSYTDDLNFEVILYPSGKITYQYETMASSTLNSATIGQQNAAKDDGLTIVYDTAYVHDNMAIDIHSPFEFLSVSPTSGTVPPHGSLDLDLTIDTSSLIGGDYFARVDLETNDPAHALVQVPVTLHVTGVPDIDADATSLAFPTIYVGFSYDLPLTIRNVGTDVLTISGYSTSGEFAVAGLTAPVSLAVGEEIPLVVTFAPTFDGAHAGSLDISSDDPDEADFIVSFTGAALIPPVAGVDPNAMATALPPGGMRTKTFTISNTGGSDLEWSVGTNFISALRSPVTVYPAMELDKDETDTRVGVLGSGGPDMFGYRWKDSDEAGGPVYDWVDISSVGTPISFSSSGDCDDCVAGPIPVGFSMPFYGAHLDNLWVSTNGWASFNSQTNADYSNDPLPSTGAAENLLAPFWDDMVLRDGIGSEPVASMVYYYNDGARFILQFQHMYRFLSYTDDLNFEVILYPNGKIVYQYETMSSATLDSATLGIQNATKDDGLTVVYNSPYVHDNFAVKLDATPEWMKMDPTSGTIPAGGTEEMAMTLNAAGLPDGIHTGEIVIQSNDPYTPSITVPITLNVSLVTPDYVNFDPGVLNLGANGTTVKMTVQLPAGLDPHMVDPCSVKLNDTVPVVGCPGTPPPNAFTFVDNWPVGGDGIDEIVFKFDRTAANAVIPEGTGVPVWIQGEVTDIQWWRGSDTVRTIRPHVVSPANGDYYIAGWNVPIRWNPPAWGGPVTYAVQLSRDGGTTWDQLATGLTGTALDWTADGSVTASARVRVVAVDDTGAVLGYDDGNGAFTLAGATLMPPREIDGDNLYVDYSPIGMTMQWKWPLADLAFGPASGFRVMTSDRPNGPWTQQALVNDVEYTDASGDPPAGGIVYYRIVSTNAAGDAQQK